MRILHFAAIVAIACLTVFATAEARDRNFRAHLSGQEEVPPADTRARGQAHTFTHNSD